MLRSIFLDALKNLSGNALRSGLTMLGVIIGVAAVITMIAIVEGGQVWLVNSLERMGTNLLFVWKKRLTVEERQLFAGRNTELRYDDALAIQTRFPDLVVAPIIELDGQLKAGDRDYSGRITGTSPEYSQIRNFRPESGRFVSSIDIKEWNRSVVLGHTIAEVLFGSQPAIGEGVKIGDQRFTVKGIMEPKGEIYGHDYDEMVIIPISTGLRFFQGSDKIRSMIIHVPDRQRMDEISQALHQFLVQRHEGVDDIHIRNQGEFLSAVDQTLLTFRLVLGGIAVISLLVGGIGIMNIMLVTVTERTREIGLRKAIGARRQDILLQFLIESTTISVIGGSIGILVGILAAYGIGDVVARAMPGGGDWGAVVQPTAIAIAFAFAVVVGVGFGLFPAMKASKLEPAEALRYQ
ncbi:ABC transporter permease [Candidatus Nitrospira neomarina]|uniref:ABC transporter permease n=1 Tax=Candidatus Nitrospira neomarina TaxID=3020899 RepID=A0AA96GMY1_9BACT|nr:ABC transporter permease [Candidatus Nitrospira neomarina]WNM60476.1 ABC transporter permease [Candidatus Nitrospira neomarina]